jgi:hypothetical protein
VEVEPYEDKITENVPSVPGFVEFKYKEIKEVGR